MLVWAKSLSRIFVYCSNNFVSFLEEKTFQQGVLQAIQSHTKSQVHLAGLRVLTPGCSPTDRSAITSWLRARFEVGALTSTTQGVLVVDGSRLDRKSTLQLTLSPEPGQCLECAGSSNNRQLGIAACPYTRYVSHFQGPTGNGVDFRGGLAHLCLSSQSRLGFSHLGNVSLTVRVGVSLKARRLQTRALRPNRPAQRHPA